MNYTLSIITPSGKIFEDEVVSLTAPGTSGFVGVLARHSPMIVSLKKGGVKVRQSSGEKFFTVGSGVMEVNDQHNVLILAESASEVKNWTEANTN